ncbi:MAG: hypothetical protein JWN01_715 [Patescibacteria group bacterium]|jgi:hypothetical protein|nr:hypothetical protein [Patescibacteria group bacterium]
MLSQYSLATPFLAESYQLNTQQRSGQDEANETKMHEGVRGDDIDIAGDHDYAEIAGDIEAVTNTEALEQRARE